MSRRFVAATAAHVGEELARPVGDLRLAAVMIDGIHFGEHSGPDRLGIDESGNKHVLGLRKGAGCSTISNGASVRSTPARLPRCEKGSKKR